MLELNKLHCVDCMEAMKDIPDGYFEWAFVDPPYGSGQNPEGGDLWARRKRSRFRRTV